MDDPRITTRLQLFPSDRQLLQEIGIKLGGSTMSAAASFLFRKAGRQILAFLEQEVDLAQSPGLATGAAQQSPGLATGAAQQSPGLATGAAQQSPGDAIDELDVLLGN